MRKKITLLLLSMACISMLYAGGGWATSAVVIAKNGGSPYSYPVDTWEGWTNGDWFVNNPLDEFNFGTPTSLVLKGACGNAWSDDYPAYTSTSFTLYYRVYKNGTTPGSWSQIAMDSLFYKNGNNYIYSKTSAKVDLLALATAPGTNTYVLEVAISKIQYYTGGSWKSMIPGGQDVAYSAGNSGYKATFTKTIVTNLKQPVKDFTIIENQGKIHADFEG